MKALDRLEWVQLYLSGRIVDDLMKKIAGEELRDSLAIAEVIGVEKLKERLEYVRDYLAGSHTNKDEALEKLCEAMAIAEALPEIEITMPGFV